MFISDLMDPNKIMKNQQKMADITLKNKNDLPKIRIINSHQLQANQSTPLPEIKPL